MFFEEKLAGRYGLEEAVMLQNLVFWCRRNRANEQHYFDGHYWTYNSASAFTKLFSFWSKPQIYRILNSLEKQGAIISGTYNKLAYDRTKWYSVIDSILDGEWCEAGPVTENEHPVQISSHGNGESVTPIPNITTDENTDTMSARFEKFWEAYPKKRNKGDAIRAFTKISPDDALLDLMIVAIGAVKETRGWKKENGQYIPYPATWLRGAGWEDELDVETEEDDFYAEL
jgi:hypothetical protein